MTVAVLPEDAADKGVTWSSSDETKAAVNADGLVTGAATGAVTITATAKDGSGVTGAIELTVTPKKATSITITPPSPRVVVGDTRQLTAEVLPADAANKEVTWSSSDISKATVDVASGLARGVAEGTATITATAKDGSGVTGTTTLTVTLTRTLSASIAITPSPASVFVGSTQQLTANVLPADATDKEVTWSSSDPSKATVDANGLATGVAEGTATITAVAKDGSGITSTIVLTVTPKKVTSIAITPSPASVAVGSTQQLTAAVLPEDAADKGVTWSSGDPSKATVDANGLVTGLTEGRATVTAAAKDGSGVTGTIELTVIQKATSIAITPAEPSAVGVNKTLA
ncbi:Ig domain-containing protein, partial [Ferrovibrio sp.]|uniref:Ig-like domain-containing protein n=1 Tax=Ferrovibrio sp. TaxID=1917215 RepID=UPI0025C10960